MIEIEEAGADVIRLINVDAIQEVTAAGEDRVTILMRDGRVHNVNVSYAAFRARLGLLLNRMLPLEATL